MYEFIKVGDKITSSFFYKVPLCGVFFVYVYYGVDFYLNSGLQKEQLGCLSGAVIGISRRNKRGRRNTRYRI